MDPALPVPEVSVSRKELKRLYGGTRPLDAWERYRALNDAMDEAYDLIDISNREARFALLLMGALNAFLVIAASRAEFVDALDTRQRLWAGGLLGVYAITAVYLVLEAIEALRPGRFRPNLGDWQEDAEDYPRRVRYFEDVIKRDVQGHWQAWRDVRVEQLNSELAIQLHSLCLKNQVKRLSLRRLYAGLRVMTLLLTGLLALFFYSAWM
jgi:hypothetical protein